MRPSEFPFGGDAVVVAPKPPPKRDRLDRTNDEFAVARLLRMRSVARLDGVSDATAKPRVHPAPPMLRRALRLSLVLAVTGPSAARAQLPESSLSVRTPTGERVWWRAREAPARWTAADPAVAGAVRWHQLGPGLESGQLDLSGDGVAWRISVVLARLDPARFRIELERAVTERGTAAWTIERAEDASLAVNVGQFQGGVVWGWLVHEGTELQPPGNGPLSAALVVDPEGRVELVEPAAIADARAGGQVREAFQSYPAVLVGDGRIPEALRGPERGVDLEHRDSRLALCMLRDGRLLFALTRFMSPGSPLARLPFGPTTPEMAALMGALGCRRAVLLDGGLSGQMSLRGISGEALRWPGLRAVPVGLLARPR